RSRLKEGRLGVIAFWNRRTLETEFGRIRRGHARIHRTEKIPDRRGVVSRVIWKNAVTADAAEPSVLQNDLYRDRIENVKVHPWTNEQIQVPDAKAFRSMSRASLFLSNICMGARETLAPYLSKSPFSVGIYCAIENGPIDVASTREILDNQPRLVFAEAY